MIPLRSVLATAAAAALLGAAPAPALHFPKASPSFTDGTSFLTENEEDARLSGVQFFFAAGLDRQTAAQSGIAALTAASLERTPVDGVAVRDAIAARGGALQYTVDARETRFYLEARPDDLPAMIALFSRALAAPPFTPGTLSASRTELDARISDVEGEGISVGLEMFRRSYYGSGAGLPTLGTQASLAALGSGDVSAFFAANYRKAGFRASGVGRITPAISGAVRALAAGLGSGGSAAISLKVKPIPSNAPRIVARRDVGAPIVVVGFAAPEPASKDFGAMLILEGLLSSAFERSSATTLGQVERSVGAQYLYDGAPASLVVFVNGNRVDPSLALRELLLVSKTLAARPMGAASLRQFKTSAEGTFVTGNVTLVDRSYLLGTLAAQGLGSDPINAALAAVERTTALDVQRVAKKYLQRYIVALVLPRQSSEGT
jgi:predicted Zn-dependent peptidase